MRLQLLSDLHLETEDFRPEPAPGAELLVLAGDIDSSWRGLALFEGWPVPVLFVPGNHEFDRRELTEALPQLRRHCDALGIRLLEKQSVVLTSASGLRVRFVGTTRWSDFELYGPSGQAQAQRAATYYVKVMRATLDGQPFDAAAVRRQALGCKAWLQQELACPRGDWDGTVVVTHYAPSALSADPRYGLQPGTASFCNADDALLPGAQLWLHGHLHCRHDYRVVHAGGGVTRVVCNPRGHASKQEPLGYDGLRVIEVDAAPSA